MVNGFIAMRSQVSWPSASRRSRHQGTPTHEVIGRRAEGEDPIDEAAAAMAEFTQQGDGLQPAERLLNELPPAMTEPIARVSGRPRVDGGAAVPEFVLGNVRR